jgi:hypothetical protein
VNAGPPDIFDQLHYDYAHLGDEDNIVFAQFLPNMMKGLTDLTDLLIAWSRRRLASAPQLVKLSRKSFDQRT